MNDLTEKSDHYLYRIKLFKQLLNDFNDKIDKSDESCNISRAVKSLLSCLQSLSKRYLIKTSYELLSDQSLNCSLKKCLSKLENIVFSDNGFAEMTVLSGLAIAFILSNYLCDIQKAIHIYFKLLSKETIIEIVFNDYEMDNNLMSVLDHCLLINDFSKVSLISGLINCTYFIAYLIDFETKVFIQIHSHIIKLCSQRMIHQFHVFRLLQHWFRTLKNNIKQIVNKEHNLFEDKSLIINTLNQIDNNWEHPINGVNDCVKLIYNLLLEIFTIYQRIKLTSDENNGSQSSLSDDYNLINEELIKALQLPLTSKAKYRKLSALIQFSGWRAAFELDPLLSHQMLKYLSINSLSSAITELYKSIIISMKANESQILALWEYHWLTPIVDALKSENKVIHSNVIAHLLPFTLKNIEHSCESIFANISDSDIAEVALVRVSVDNKLTNHLLPPHSWIKKIIANNKEAVREEGLSLLLDERYITDRQQVFELLILFLTTNLNIDNPSFRQKIVSKIEQFLTKICVSIRDKLTIHSFHDQYDKNALQFLADYTDILISYGLIAGASYQRRTTSLLLLETLFVTKNKYNVEFDNYIHFNTIYELLLLSVIDKDDKVRKLASNLLTTFCNSNKNKIHFNLDTIAYISIKFLDSPRHQESHSGALMMKYIINNFNPFSLNGKELNNELEIIEYLLESAHKQYKSVEENPLNSAKNFPIHGYILALNNCLPFDCLENFSSEDRFLVIINDIISLCFDCINFMLRQLSQTNIESSPSFQEMCQSLEGLIIEEDSENYSDISTSNNFQLLLSMCWLNIKECSFLLSNLIELSEKFTFNIINEQIIPKIGSQLVNILIKCRHKGVIEANCIALTKYTVSLIRMKTRCVEHIQTLSKLLTDSLNCITKSAFTSSITRRSAGLAMIIQAILIGESEAYNEGFKLDISLFSQTIDELILIAKLDLPEIIDDKSDLPQTYALHILKSIVSTASLSRFTTKRVEFVVPICIQGFCSNVWQIRNASLQLFGSCCCRILGQPKLSDVDQYMSEGSTITCEELFSRYPTLLSVIKSQIKDSLSKINNGNLCSELVPTLSLLASLSPIWLTDSQTDQQIIEYLVILLGNKIWKVRMLSAKALSNLLSINELQNILFRLCNQQNINCNSIHGLILLTHHSLELQKTLKTKDYELIKDQFCNRLIKLINANLNCKVLRDVYNEIFLSINTPFNEFNDNENVHKITFTNDNLDELLDQIHSNVQFNKSDDIRLLAAKTLNESINGLNEISKKTNYSLNIFKLVENVLIILEDEDKTVRTEGEHIVSKLLNQNGSVMSFNVAIDNLLIWLINNPFINENELMKFLISKLESAITLREIIVLKEENREILFEKEEKNVFAEPLFLLFKFSECLKILISKNSLITTEKSFTKLINDCQYFWDQKSILEIQNMAFFSIWKLPKLFQAISSLYLRIDLFLYSYDPNSRETLDMPSKIRLSKGINLSNVEIVNNSTNCEMSTTNMFNKLNKNELIILKNTKKLLNSKFPFFSIINRNILSGYLLSNYEI